MKVNAITNKKIIIIGLSCSGFAAAVLAKRKNAKVFVSEIMNTRAMRQKAKILKRKGIHVELGKHTDSFLKHADFLIASPGIKPDAYPFVWARKHNVEILSEIELASWFCSCPIVAITGSNGKTTVTTLLGRIFKNAGKKVIVCGNIGNPFSGEYNKFKRADVVVLEVSSFQLEHIKYFRPKVSIILNITQNHFDHHKNMREYFQAKSNILINQRVSDVSILNISDLKVSSLAKKTKAQVWFFAKDKKNIRGNFKKLTQRCWLDKNKVYLKYANKTKKIFQTNELKIKGVHNMENAMAAVLAARAIGVKSEVIVNSLKNFRGLEHRCEKVATKNGVDFINDSKSTTVDATAKALSIFKDRSVFLICGGRDKGSNFKTIGTQIRKKVKMLFVMGEAAEKITKTLGRSTHIRQVKTLQDAVGLAYKNAKADTTVLLSPMCASFDMFESFKHRGRTFKNIVKRI